MIALLLNLGCLDNFNFFNNVGLWWLLLKNKDQNSVCSIFPRPWPLDVKDFRAIGTREVPYGVAFRVSSSADFRSSQIVLPGAEKVLGRSRDFSRSTQDSNLEPPDDNMIQRWSSSVVRCAIQLRQQTQLMITSEKVWIERHITNMSYTSSFFKRGYQKRCGMHFLFCSFTN